MPTTSPSDPLGQRNQTLRLRARLLEFLKFRVLAAQERFFSDLQREGDAGGAAGAASAELDLTRFRRWLEDAGWREALALGDADLAAVLEQARALYTEHRG